MKYHCRRKGNIKCHPKFEDAKRRTNLESSPPVTVAALSAAVAFVLRYDVLDAPL